MIPITSVVNEIKRAEKASKKIFLKQQILQTIELYLRSKIRSEIFEWGDSISSRKYRFNLKHYYRQFFRRLIYGGGRLRSYKNEAEAEMELLLMDDISSVKELKIFQKAFFAHLSGRSEKELLAPVLQKYHFSKIPVSDRKLYASLFDLFRLICRDKQLLTENEFQLMNKKLKHTENPHYDDDYPTYQYEKLKEWIIKK